MKNILLLLLFNLTGLTFLFGQSGTPNEQQRKAISFLIDEYSQAREKRDTALLKAILTTDVDQLVSTGEWRNGVHASVEGMLRSSNEMPGTRTLSIEKIKMFDSNIAIVDCRYNIEDRVRAQRKMWSTFIVVLDKGTWKISAIRNMHPSR
jgi:hypothetical protein